MTQIIKNGIKLALISYTALTLGVASIAAKKISKGEYID